MHRLRSALRRIPIVRIHACRDTGSHVERAAAVLRPNRRLHRSALLTGFDLLPSILVPAFIGELLFAVCVIVKGVNVSKWQEKAEHSTASL